MKNKIQTTLIIAILLSVFLITMVSNVKAQSLGVAISLGKGFHTESGAYVFVGEIKNTGDKPLTNIILRVNGYDSSNNVVWYDDTVRPELFLLMPGARSPFATNEISGMNPDKISKAGATVTNSEESAFLPKKLTLSSVDASLGGMPMTIGQCKQSGTAESEIINVYVTYFDSQGKVIGIDTDQNDITEPGEVFNFNTRRGNPIQFAPNAEAFSYVVTAESFLGHPAQYEVDAEVSTHPFTQTEFTNTTTPTPTVPEFTAPLAAVVLIVILSASVVTRKLKNRISK